MNPQDQPPAPQPPATPSSPGFAPQLQQPVTSPPPMMAEPPKSKRKLWIVIIIALLVLAPVAYVVATKVLGGKGSGGGDANLGTLKTGSFNYLNACEVFTAADLDKVTGKASNRQEVGATFAQKTDNEGDPLRTYRSSCIRTTSTGFLAGDIVQLTMLEYSNADVQAKGELLNTIPSSEDPSVATTLGEGASYARSTLYMTVGNKEITLRMNLVEDKAKSKEWAVALGQAMKTRITELAAKPSKVLAHSGDGLKVGAFAYRNTCDLWGPSNFRSVMGVDPDEGAVETTYAESVQSVGLRLSSKCTIGEKPDKTELNTGKPIDFETLLDSMHVSIASEQYLTAQSAASNFASVTAGGQEFDGIGDGASLSEISSGSGKVVTMRVLAGNAIHAIQINRNDSGKSVQDAGDTPRLIQIATEIAANSQ